MQDSRFNPPTTPVSDPPAESISWFPAWVAASAATGSAYLVGSVFSPFLQHWFARKGGAEGAWYHEMVASSPFSVISLLLSACGYVLGGYIAASLSHGHRARDALFAAVICLLIGAVGYLGVVPSPLPYWAQAFGFLMTVPCFLIGMRWRARDETVAIVRSKSEAP